jgi:hypothetical protein
VLVVTGLVAAGFGGLAGVVLGLERRRRSRFIAGAAARGWTYAPRDRRLPQRWDSWPFGQGRRRRARHVLRGTVDDRPCVAFEYTFRHRVPGGPQGPAEAVATWSVVAVALPSPLPRVAVARSGPLGRVAAALGRQGFELESEDFNRRFRVRTDDPRVASDVLHPRMMAELLDGPFYDFRLDAADALSCRPGRMRLEDVDDRLAFLSRVVARIPAYVWRDRPT